MKKFILLIILFPITVFATGSIKPSVSQLNIFENETNSFSLIAQNAAGRVDISVSDPSVASINTNSVWLDNNTEIITVTALKIGKCVIMVKLFDAGTFDEETLNDTYAINLNVEKKPNTNNYLSLLSVDDKNITLDKNKLNYSITVGNDKKSVVIKAQSDDATVSGIGLKNLNVYNNYFKIIVTSEKGENRTYNLTVIREDENGRTSPKVEEAFLKELIISGYDINFDKNVVNYLINVNNDVTNLNVSAKAENESDEVIINNQNALEVGSNRISIIVKNKTSEKEYTIMVNKQGDTPTSTLTTILNILNENKSPFIILNINNNNTTIPTDILSRLKETNTKLIVNKTENNKLLYSIYFNDVLDDTKEIDLNINKQGSNFNLFNTKGIYLNLSNLPKKTTIKINTDNYQNNDELGLYKIVKNKPILDKKVIVKDNLIVVEDYNEEIFISNNKPKSSMLTIILIEIFVILLLITGTVIILNKRKKQN